MSTLTPTARAILTHLRDQPADAATLRDATRRSLTTIEKTLTDLTHRGLTTQHPGDDGTDYWTLTDTGRASIDDPTTDQGGTATDDAAPDGDNDDNPADEHGEEAGDKFGDGPGSGDDQPSHPDGPGDGPEPHPDAQDGPASAADDDHEPAAREPEDAPVPVKHCRGCQKELPPMCPTCWQKTPLYCGQCRRTLPVGRRGAPSEPEILSNGLPKLKPGELEKLVLDVFANHSVPDFQGVVGWTPGRIAIHLPGRSTGAIAKVLEKLTGTGQAVLINASPKYYRPVLDTTTTTGPSDEPGAQDPPAADNEPDTTPDHGPAEETEPDTGEIQGEPDSDQQRDPHTSDRSHADDQHDQ